MLMGLVPSRGSGVPLGYVLTVMIDSRSCLTRMMGRIGGAVCGLWFGREKRGEGEEKVDVNHSDRY